MKNNALMRILTAGVVIAGSAGSALAAETKPLTIEVSANALYDSNVVRGSDASADSRGLDKEDVKFAPTVDVTLNRSLGRHSLTAVGSLGYEFYLHNTRLNRERLKADVNLGMRLPFCAADLRSSVARRQSDLADIGVIPGDEEASSDNAETYLSAGASVSCGGAVGFRPTAIVDWSRASNSAEIRKNSDNTSFSYGGGVQYTQPAIGDITFYIGRREVRYPNRDIILTPAIQRYNQSRYGVIVSRDVGSRVKLDGEVMYTRATFEGGVEPFSGVNWRLGATVSFAQLQLNAETSRSIDPSLGFIANYVLQTNNSLTASYYINPRLSASLGGQISVRDYNYDPSVIEVRILHDNIKRIRLALAYTATPRISIGLSGTYQKRDADGVFYDYDGYQIGFSARTKF